jgi:protein-tyrosine phosphatase
MVRVLFVCLGNICRSPTAEAVFRAIVERAGLSHAIEIESAGTHAYHVGNGADPRSLVAARRRGYDLSAHCARRVAASDFRDFDYVLAMDRENLRDLQSASENLPHREGEKRAKVALFLSFAPSASVDEVPDPYLRGDEGFEQVLDLVESAGEGLLERIRTNDLAGRRQD